MLKMNREEALREVCARQSVLRTITLPDAYNTGARSTTSDAAEYITLWLHSDSYLSSWVRVQGGSSLPATQVPGVLVQSTGTAGYQLIASLNDEQVEKIATLHPSALPFALPTVANALETVVTPAEMIAAVRNVFMLSVQDAAAVFRVTRPTIYQWQTLREMETVRAREDRERMKALYRVAIEWSNERPLVGRWLTQPLARTGNSVLDLLSAKNLDVAAIRSARPVLEQAATNLAREEHKRSQHAAEGLGKAVARLAQRRQRKKDAP